MFFFFTDGTTPAAVPSLPNVTPADVKAVGEAVYGHLWHRQLTDRIGALREDSGKIAPTAVYGWAAGERPIPAYVGPMLARVLEEGEGDLLRRLGEIRALRKRVEMLPPPAVRPPRNRPPTA
ncbi:hypothetical protein OKC48_07460 [Methylorubrum extorquens]|uniref:hypothetical protein n=1 Tax=Methylorubrum extorquens TaxID=408 RepID=UPI002238C15C|nr:hypothetical protein [Methylorubrum extorquens]UYW28343.1 hypothetical protein OKC48_07460 [Methylorubrum extorquens]